MSGKTWILVLLVFGVCLHSFISMLVYNELPTMLFAVIGLLLFLLAAYWLYKRMLNSRKKYKVVFVLGGPGAGKGTQSALIYEKFGYVHLSAGDLLREERNSGSKLADMINTYIKEGKIVPADITVSLLKKSMEKSLSNKFLVDGFPRDLDNLKCWENKMSSVVDVQFLLFLDCPQEIMIDRLLERGKTSGRNDDNIESIKKRFKTYEESTRPIINYFRSIGKIRTVESNRSVDRVFADVSKCFQEVARGDSMV